MSSYVGLGQMGYPFAHICSNEPWVPMTMLLVQHNQLLVPWTTFDHA